MMLDVREQIVDAILERRQVLLEILSNRFSGIFSDVQNLGNRILLPLIDGLHRRMIELFRQHGIEIVLDHLLPWKCLYSLPDGVHEANE